MFFSAHTCNGAYCQQFNNFMRVQISSQASPVTNTAAMFYIFTPASIFLPTSSVLVKCISVTTYELLAYFCIVLFGTGKEL